MISSGGVGQRNVAGILLHWPRAQGLRMMGAINTLILSHPAFQRPPNAHASAERWRSRITCSLHAAILRPVSRRGTFPHLL